MSATGTEILTELPMAHCSPTTLRFSWSDFIKAILISFSGAEGILSPVDTGYGSGDGKVTSSADQCRLKNMVQHQDNGKKIIKKEWKHFNTWVS